jgi:hypothetical protein
MNRRRRPVAALALIAMVALISACGSTAPAGTGSGSSGGNNAPAGTGSSGGNTTASKREKAVKFEECMRENGVSDFPDPNAAGRVRLRGQCDPRGVQEGRRRV